MLKYQLIYTVKIPKNFAWTFRSTMLGTNIFSPQINDQTSSLVSGPCTAWMCTHRKITLSFIYSWISSSLKNWLLLVNPFFLFWGLSRGAAAGSEYFYVRCILFFWARTLKETLIEINEYLIRFFGDWALVLVLLSVSWISLLATAQAFLLKTHSYCHYTATEHRKVMALSAGSN